MRKITLFLIFMILSLIGVSQNAFRWSASGANLKTKEQMVYTTKQFISEVCENTEDTKIYEYKDGVSIVTHGIVSEVALCSSIFHCLTFSYTLKFNISNTNLGYTKYSMIISNVKNISHTSTYVVDYRDSLIFSKTVSNGNMSNNLSWINGISNSKKEYLIQSLKSDMESIVYNYGDYIEKY